MKEKILELRKLGLSYNEIVEKLGCAKSTVAYHCSDSVKSKNINRGKNDKNKSLIKRVSRFKTEDTINIRSKVGEFNRDKGHKYGFIQNFGYKDVLDRFGENTNCYLTGTPINLINDDYCFDHIVPRSKGGSLQLDNLGVTIPIANKAKSDMSPEELIDLCKKILIHHGYKIEKI